jgi:choline dehydrogenase
VLVTAGAIGTPKLLMLSGVGPAEHLLGHGLGVRVDAPAVGRNHQNHVRQKLGYTTRDPVTAYGLISPPALAKAGVAYLAGGRGALGRSALTAGGLLRSAPDLAVPDTGVIFSPGLMGAGRGPLGPLPRRHGFSAFVRQARPWSRGEVRLRSADPLAAPGIDTRYFSDPRDMPALIEGVRRVKEIFARPEIAAVVEQADNSELTPQAVARTAAHAFHPVGTCAVGAVVDEALRVRGVDGLRVADASVIPVIPKGGTNAPAIMIGERAAALIAAGG